MDYQRDPSPPLLMVRVLTGPTFELADYLAFIERKGPWDPRNSRSMPSQVCSRGPSLSSYHCQALLSTSHFPALLICCKLSSSIKDCALCCSMFLGWCACSRPSCAWLHTSYWIATSPSVCWRRMPSSHWISTAGAPRDRTLLLSVTPAECTCRGQCCISKLVACKVSLNPPQLILTVTKENLLRSPQPIL